MGDKKKIDRKRLKDLETQAIPMSTFLAKLLGVRSENVGELTHKDLSFLMPNLQRTSYSKILDDPKMVYSGEVVLVLDAARNIVPYIVEPQITPVDSYGVSDAIDTESWEEQHKEEIPNLRDYDLKKMSIYELEQLLAIYHSTNQIGYYERVRKEIVSRADSKQGVRRSKEKSLRKELKRKRQDAIK